MKHVAARPRPRRADRRCRRRKRRDDRAGPSRRSGTCRSNSSGPIPNNPRTPLFRRRARRAGALDPRARHHPADRGAAGRGAKPTPSRSSPASGAGARRSAPACTTCRSSCSKSATREALELAIIENVQRTDLNPIEEAIGYQALIDAVSAQPGRYRPDRRQEPQPCREHAAAAEAARHGEGLYPLRASSPPAMPAR